MKKLLLVLVLVACKKSAKKEEAPPAAADAQAVIADAAVDAAVDAAEAPDAAAAAVPTPPPGVLAATAEGVGPLKKDSDISVKALKAAFEGYDVKKVSKKMGDGDLREEYIGISKDKKLVLKVVGDGSLVNIDIMSDTVWNPWGLKLGTTYKDVETVAGKLDCNNAGDDTDWRAHIAACSSEKLGRYELDFASEGDSAEEMLKIPALLADAKLVAIRFQAWDGPPGAPQ